MAKGITTSVFAVTKEDCQIRQFTMTNDAGAQVKLLEYGACIHQVLVPNREGKLENIAFSLDQLEADMRSMSCAGAICGPVANRISGAVLELNGVQYNLEKNDGENHLHGGSTGFHQQLWQGKILSDEQVCFTLNRPDGQGGYPGEMQVQVSYTWNDKCALTISFRAVSSRNTVCNLTNHAYWSLDGYGADVDVLDQNIQIFSNTYTEMNASVVPTGRILTSQPELDMRKAKNIRRMLSVDAQQLAALEGFGHTYELKGVGLKPAAVLTAPRSGRCMRVFTTYPAVLFYSGFQYGEYRTGVALECQYHPDAMRHDHFPSIILPAGKVYEETTVYQFGVE